MAGLKILNYFIILHLFSTVVISTTEQTTTKDTLSADGTSAATTLKTVSTSIDEATNGGDNITQDNSTLPANTTQKPTEVTVKLPDLSYLDVCPDNAPCADLGAACIDCKLNHYCTYGSQETGECTVKANITCIGDRTFQRPYTCSYGYQLDKEQVVCNMALATSCTMKKTPPGIFIALCKVKDEVLCLGNRTYYRTFPCNWTSGYKWSTALILSITLGGFGVDRFYLGLWREAMGKLFSFGGLGVWTLVDVMLIAMGYVGPHDDSLYIYPWN